MTNSALGRKTRKGLGWKKYCMWRCDPSFSFINIWRFEKEKLIIAMWVVSGGIPWSYHLASIAVRWVLEEKRQPTINSLFHKNFLLNRGRKDSEDFKTFKHFGALLNFSLNSLIYYSFNRHLSPNPGLLHFFPILCSDYRAHLFKFNCNIFGK